MVYKSQHTSVPAYITAHLIDHTPFRLIQSSEDKNKIINGLAQVPFEGVLVEAYKGTRRKHNMKFRQIGHTTSQYGKPFFPLKLLVHGTGLLSLKLCHWLYLDPIFFKISVHPFRIIP